MTRISKWGVAVVCGSMLLGLLPAASEGGLFGRRGCGSHGGWRGGGGSHGSFGGWRNGCGSHGGYARHGSHGSHGGYVTNGCGSHGGYSKGDVHYEGEAVPHEAQYHGDYDRTRQTYPERDWQHREGVESPRQALRDEDRAVEQQRFRNDQQGRALDDELDQDRTQEAAPGLTPPEPPAPPEAPAAPQQPAAPGTQQTPGAAGGLDDSGATSKPAREATDDIN